MTPHSSRLTQSFLLALILLLGIATAQAQTLCLKTNMLRDLSGTINLGAEYALGNKASFDLGVSYNPWTYKENQKERQISFQPAIKIWPQASLIGWFIGLEGHAGLYNRGNITYRGLSVERMWGIEDSEYLNYRYEGWQYGGGLLTGYSWPLNKRLNLEASLGIGYSYFDYSKNNPEAHGIKIEDGTQNLFGITQLGLTAIYILY